MKLFSKLIVLSILIIYVFAAINIVPIEKRGIVAEPVIFEVEVDAPCESYVARTLSSIQVSSVTNNTCLPISSVDPTQDINDYNAHVMCTNTFNGKSLFRFHEIFIVDEDETPAPGAHFIVSWLSDFPFIERHRKYSYARRPSCSIGTDVCSTTQIVNECYDNHADLHNGFVSTSDRVYFIPPDVTVGTCSLDNNCCPYISISSTGICGGQAVDPCSSLNCNDGNACTTDSCSGGVCSNTPISCNDGNACTQDTCDSTSGCVHTTISCDDGFLCTTDTCDAATGCSNTQITCSSSDFCQINPRCDNNTGSCTTDARVCTSNDPCVVSSICDSASSSCLDTPKSCPGNGCFINGVCNSTTGACSYTKKVCDDANSCTLNRCDNTTGCYYPQANCSDGNLCSVDYCDSASGCVHIFYCQTNDECFDKTCTNTCTSGVPCDLDPDESGQNTTDLVVQRTSLYCVTTPTGADGCKRNELEPILLEEKKMEEKKAA